ncbi:hypothetical protein AVEN_266161-1 [Araneus ventricosus]|uniref:Mos1 transposase HTH domain-containing protein n=1 Tax=Araneus ventricosus TaxID=182803 RepID=A0A4Y2UGU6_ARAVE|nr:hypothetical protein AVEN_7302-1 [Araneus ventricosus]GBO11354.1 hypothetical protein AVEN_266161-1 [Araneus ventricosus]
MDSSRSAQRAVIQFLRAEWEHASQIYRRMKEVFGEKCLARCTIFWWCQFYEAGRVNIKDSPRPGQAHIVSNSATISAVDELIRHNLRITTREISVELSITKGMHHIMKKSLVLTKFVHIGCPSIGHRIRRRREWRFVSLSFYTEANLFLIMSIIYCYTVPHEL